jgi:hypothetical protein
MWTQWRQKDPTSAPEKFRTCASPYDILQRVIISGFKMERKFGFSLLNFHTYGAQSNSQDLFSDVIIST